MNPKFSFFEFFAGAGMVRIGLGARWRCLFANDIDAMKCDVYRANFGGGELIERDIAALSVSALPNERPDLMWGSFPCQDLSLAGMRGGIKSERSGAYFDFHRLARQLCRRNARPKIIAVENVAGLLTSNGGLDFHSVVSSLAELQYFVTAFILDAKSFTPQSRQRLFIIAFARDALPSRTAQDHAIHAHPSLTRAVADFSGPARRHWFYLDIFPRQIRNISLADIVDGDCDNWHTNEQTERLIGLMNPNQRRRVMELRDGGRRHVGAGFRRIRSVSGQSTQRFEARFDGLAGCLRTPAGGSSRQVLIVIDNHRISTRLLNGKEAARLMGLPEDFVLPSSETAALKICGDGVCSPVIRWLADNVFEPTLMRSHVEAA